MKLCEGCFENNLDLNGEYKEFHTRSVCAVSELHIFSQPVKYNYIIINYTTSRIY